MKAVILAAGFATRLRPITDDLPKSLLSLCGRTVIDEQVDKLVSTERIDDIFVVTNAKFYGPMEKWRESSVYRDKIKIINDGVTREESKRGAIGTLKFCMDEVQIADDFLVLGSDNLFEDTFDGIINFFYQKQGCPVVAIHHIDNTNLSRQSSEVVLEPDTGRVTTFVEKPANPKSPYLSSLLYVMSLTILREVGSYLNSGSSPDNIGNFIAWLVSRNFPVFGYETNGRRFDIGDHQSYASTVSLYPCRKRDYASVELS